MRVKRRVLVAGVLGVQLWALGQASEKVKRPSTQPVRLYGEVHALCIGINEYPRLVRAADADPTLDTPERTATTVGALLEQGFGYRIKTRVGRVSKSEFESAINDTTLGPDDAFILFVSMHGASVENPDRGFEGFLVPSDAHLSLEDTRDFDAWRREAISMRWLGEQCKKLQAKHVLVIVEACFSGYMGTMGESVTLPRSYEILASKRSRAAMTGGTRKQVLRDGVFGEAFRDVLKELIDPKSMRAVTARELHLLARDKVMGRVGDAMRPQYREMLSDEGEFVFVPLGVDPQSVAEQVRQSSNAVAKTMGDAIALKELFAAFEAGDYRYSAKAPELERVWRSRLARFERHADSGDPLAMAGLYYCYKRGLGTEKDLSVALRWAQEAFDSGHVVGRHVLGESYAAGTGITKNALVADALWEKAATNGFALSELTRLSFESDAQFMSDPDKVRKFVMLYEKLVEQGSNMARVGLAETHDGTWVGRPRDPRKAREILAHAAKEEFGLAQFMLFQNYASALATQDPTLAEDAVPEARRWLDCAAKNGNADAQWLLAQYYLQEAGYKPPLAQELGFKKNYNEARKWAELASQQGHMFAKMVLAAIHFNGLGVDKKPDKARELVEDAAGKYHAPAIVQQGLWYQDGAVYPRDDEKAFQLFKKAALMSDADGCFHLAKCYEDRRGVDLGGRSRAERPFAYLHGALYWYMQAAKQNHADATRAVCDRSRWAIPSSVVEEMERLFPGSAAEYHRLQSVLCKK